MLLVKIKLQSENSPFSTDVIALCTGDTSMTRRDAKRNPTYMSYNMINEYLWLLYNRHTFVNYLSILIFYFLYYVKILVLKNYLKKYIVSAMFEW